MSDLLASPPDDYYEDENSSRNRAVWGLVALAILAALIVVIMLATSGSGHHGNSAPTGAPGLSGLSQLPPESPSPTTAPTRPTTSAVVSSSTATSAVPTSTANPCGAAKSCAVPGDAGQLVAAVNQFRTAHGRAAVTGTVTPQAQQCAAAKGEGPSCAPSYAWEPVPTQDGPKAVGLVSPAWLLDPTMRSFQVGWAYAGGQWECAILKLR